MTKTNLQLNQIKPFSIKELIYMSNAINTIENIMQDLADNYGHNFTDKLAENLEVIKCMADALACKKIVVIDDNFNDDIDDIEVYNSCICDNKEW